MTEQAEGRLPAAAQRNRGGFAARPCVFQFRSPPLPGGGLGYSSSQASSEDDRMTCWLTGAGLGIRRVSPQVAVST